MQGSASLATLRYHVRGARADLVFAQDLLPPGSRAHSAVLT